MNSKPEERFALLWLKTLTKPMLYQALNNLVKQEYELAGQEVYTDENYCKLQA